MLTAVGGAFLAGIIVAQPPGNSPDQTPPGAAGGDASPAAFHGELQPVESCDELLDHYVDEALEIVGPHGWEFGGGSGRWTSTATSSREPCPVPPPRSGEMTRQSNKYSADSAESPRTSTSVNSDTGTNVQEQGVDEPDVVKTDGDLLVRIQDATLTTYDVTGEETRSSPDPARRLRARRDPALRRHRGGARQRRHPVAQPRLRWYGDPGPITDRVVSVDISDPATPQVATPST